MDADAPWPSFFDERIVTARKNHTCDACGETIRPGHTYRRVAGKWDGDFQMIVQCGRCSAMYDAICDAAPSPSEVVMTLDCDHSWDDAFGSPAPEEVQALAFALPGEVIAAKQGGGE